MIKRRKKGLFTIFKMTTFGRLGDAIGSEIRIKTEEGIYVGKVHIVNKVLQTLTLSRVKSFDEGEEILLPGLLVFHKDEILDFEFINFPKAKVVPQKQVASPKNSTAVSLPQKSLPRPNAVVKEPRQPEPPPVAKALVAQNGLGGNESLQQRIVEKQVPSSNINTNGCAKTNFPNCVSTLPNSQNKNETSQKQLESNKVPLNNSIKSDVAQSSLCNGGLAKKNYASSLWNRVKYFNDAKSLAAGQNNRVPNQFVVIEHIDDDFYEMIDLIFSQSVIGCGFDGVSLGRHGKLCWIQISTVDLVIVFDLLSMNCEEALNSGLKEILTTQDITKVIHDCRQASDMLFHQYNIQLGNVFDTQVADVMVMRINRHGRMPKYVRSLSTCLKFYLNLTQEQLAFYEIRKASIEKDGYLWRHRPMSEFLIETMGLNVRYLKSLRLATLDGMLVEFTQGVDLFLHSVRNQKDEEAAKHTNGELLPGSFHDFSYGRIMELDPAMQGPRLNSRHPEAIDERYYDKVNPAMQNGHRSSYTVKDCNSYDNSYGEMPGLEDIEDLPGMENEAVVPVLGNTVDMRKLNDIAEISDLDVTMDLPELEDLDVTIDLPELEDLDVTIDLPELEDIDVESCDSVRIRSSKQITKLKDQKFRRNLHKKPFESSDDETGSLDLRLEHLYRKVRQGFRKEIPDSSEVDLDDLESVSKSNCSPRVASHLSKSPEARPFVDEPILGRYAIQPRIRLENIPQWQETPNPVSKHLNILPAGKKPN